MASSSLNAEGQKRMRVMSLDYLKNSLLRKTSPKTVCCCNDDLGLNLVHEHTFTDFDCDPSVELKSGSCKKCGKTKIKNKTGLFKFLRKWLWWQNNLGVDSVNNCADTEPVSCSTDSPFPIVPNDISKDNVQCNNSVVTQCLDSSTSKGNLNKLSLTLDLDVETSNLTESSDNVLDNAVQCIENDNEGECSFIVSSDLNSVYATQDINEDGEVFSYNTVSETEPLPSPTTRSLTCELLKLSKFGWYWGPISREEAEEKLQNQPDGAFLVRDSSASHYLLSLSFRSSGKILHARIEHSQGLFSLYNQPEQGGFATIVELINHSVSLSKSAVFCYSRPRSPGHPAFPVRLTKPVSRFTQIKSLQYLCRFVIRQNVTIDNIESLPLPIILKKYIEESHY